ncbi:MAG: bacillithiol system redox-active protein YtxJ [Chitinophagaceae bacterium]
MHWIHLTSEDQLQNIVVRSEEKPQVIFKYSSRCFLSDVIFKRLQQKSCPEQVDFYFLDIISYCKLSDAVAGKFHVQHESPQVLVIKDGECVFDESHSQINMEEILEQAIETIQ